MNKNNPEKILAKKLLHLINDHHGSIEWRDLVPKVKAYYFANRDTYGNNIPNDKKIVSALYILECDDALEKVENIPSIVYRLKPWGKILIKPWYKKFLYFLIFKNHNLFSLIAILVSIATFVLSIFKII